MQSDTLQCLQAQHNNKTVIPLEEVAKVHFDMTKEVLTRRIREGTIILPVIEMDDSRKSAKGVHIQDLADYIDSRRAEALKMVS